MITTLSEIRLVKSFGSAPEIILISAANGIIMNSLIKTLKKNFYVIGIDINDFLAKNRGSFVPLFCAPIIAIYVINPPTPIKLRVQRNRIRRIYL